MIKEIEILIPPADIDDQHKIKVHLSNALRIPLLEIIHFKILKRSIDARSRKPVYRLKIILTINEAFPIEEIFSPQLKNIQNAKRVLIIGAGPAGLFAALRLIELGLKPVLIERGKDVKSRRRDLALITKDGIVNPDSNYCFGEGGAGTYSDGKLYTRSNKRGDINRILNLFVYHGANPDILIDARPHIGTNKLPRIIEKIRESILSAGAEIHFDTKITDFNIQSNKLNSAISSNGNEYEGEALILATGHSARDIYKLLHNKNIEIEAKPIAIGIRVEHPQEVIDNIQYHCDARPEGLPPAYYSLVEQVDERGVFSFCMCPGGIIAPCATNTNEIVVNGWSPSKRNNPYANSGMVVQINLEDLKLDPLKNPFMMMDYQQKIEQQAFLMGGQNLQAPAQKMVDFVEGRVSSGELNSSYLPGLKSIDLKDLLPEFISSRLKIAFSTFGKKMKGYYTNEAVLVAVESRTSAPLRIPRDKENLNHPQIQNLFPCGEGAGHAGGIVSAAIDGEKCAEAIAKQLL